MCCSLPALWPISTNGNTTRSALKWLQGVGHFRCWPLHCSSVQILFSASGWMSKSWPSECNDPLLLHSFIKTPSPRFLLCIEEGYCHSSTNPYHSSTHAADVLRTLHVILTRGGVLAALQLAAAGRASADGGAAAMADDSNFRASTLFIAYFAAVVHDFDHRGGARGIRLAPPITCTS